MIKLDSLSKILCCYDVIFEIEYPKAESEDLHSYPLPLLIFKFSTIKRHINVPLWTHMGHKG